VARHIKGLRMKNASLLCLVVMAGAFAGNAEAIYKCTTAKGVVYQDRPCREGTESDVQIVVPTGELAPKSLAAQDDGSQANLARSDNRFAAPRQDLKGDESASAAKSGDKRAALDAAATAANDSRKRNARTIADNAVPMSPEQARQIEATAKYLTTDAAAPGADTPAHMTCESPTGEKRRFVLTDGKLTSI
jgi:hypothetical protein